jgi:hypothetical protein
MGPSDIDARQVLLRKEQAESATKALIVKSIASWICLCFGVSWHARSVQLVVQCEEESASKETRTLLMSLQDPQAYILAARHA